QVVAPAQNPQALSAAIDAVVSGLGSPEHVARMQQGRERVGQMFSLDAMVRNYDKVWRGVAVPGHRPADRRLLYVVNNPAFFLSHRLPLAQAAQAAGFDVHVATMDGPSVPEIVRLGLT